VSVCVGVQLGRVSVCAGVQLGRLSVCAGVACRRHLHIPTQRGRLNSRLFMCISFVVKKV